MILPKASANVLEQLLSSWVGENFVSKRTLDIIQERYHWDSCRRDVGEWCKRYDMWATKNEWKEIHDSCNGLYLLWHKVVPIPKKETHAVADAFVEQVIVRPCVPLELQSDQGENFECNLWQEVMNTLAIKEARTTHTQMKWLNVIIQLFANNCSCL